MTTQELIIRAFHDSGEPEDMQIFTTPGDTTTFDLALSGSQSILSLLNSALVRIANWRFRDQRVLRIRDLRGRLMFNTGSPVSGAVLSATADSITVEGLSPNYADQFDGWVVEITGGTGSGQIATCRDSVVVGTDAMLFVEPVWTTTPDATSAYRLYKNFFELRRNPTMPWESYHIGVDFTSHLGDIIKLRDVGGLFDLTRVANDDLFTTSMRSSGVPSQWQMFGNQLWLDAAPVEARTYELLYVKNPATLVGANDVPDLPEMYHEAVILWAVHNIMRRNQDFNAAYATKRELEDLMEMLRLQGSFDNDAELGGITVWG